jgi:hypothetical protein
LSGEDALGVGTNVTVEVTVETGKVSLCTYKARSQSGSGCDWMRRAVRI